MLKSRAHSEPLGLHTRTGSLLRTLLLCCLALGSFLPSVLKAQNANERKLITRVEPEYPETLKRLYIGGTVKLEIVISAQGTIQNVTLLGGNPILGQSAIAAIKKWKYVPTKSPTTARVTLEFDPHR
jgi:TonB family protein